MEIRLVHRNWNRGHSTCLYSSLLQRSTSELLFAADSFHSLSFVPRETVGVFDVSWRELLNDVNLTSSEAKKKKGPSRLHLSYCFTKLEFQKTPPTFKPGGACYFIALRIYLYNSTSYSSPREPFLHEKSQYLSKSSEAPHFWRSRWHIRCWLLVLSWLSQFWISAPVHKETKWKHRLDATFRVKST